MGVVSCGLVSISHPHSLISTLRRRDNPWMNWLSGVHFEAHQSSIMLKGKVFQAGILGSTCTSCPTLLECIVHMNWSKECRCSTVEKPIQLRLFKCLPSLFYHEINSWHSVLLIPPRSGVLADTRDVLACTFFVSGVYSFESAKIWKCSYFGAGSHLCIYSSWINIRNNRSLLVKRLYICYLLGFSTN